MPENWEEQHQREVDQGQRLSKIVDQTIKSMPVDPSVDNEERARARAMIEPTIELTNRLVTEQLAVLKTLGFVLADADQSQNTPTMRKRAYERCQVLFGDPRDPAQRAPGMPEPYTYTPKPDPDWNLGPPAESDLTD